MNEATIQYVKQHLEEDVSALALRGCRDKDVDLSWALDQIKGWQVARKKLPSWAAIDGIIYPPHLSMEQCSSEQTALYKCSIIERLPKSFRKTLIDLTGGFGVDFAFMARCFGEACYVERQEHLCEGARHNFDLLGLSHAKVIHAEAEQVLDNLTTDPKSTFFYLDPARRDNNSARTYAIGDCTPNVLELLPRLLQRGQHVLFKLSPMLDWHKAITDLEHHVGEVHIVSVGNECKELLLLISGTHEGEPVIHCVNDEQRLIFKASQENGQLTIADNSSAAYLYEPNASIMKAGCFDLLTMRYPVAELSIDSHLFVSDDLIEDFPGRRFTITAITSMNKKELGRALSGITHANVAVRNFPMSAQQLRQKLRLKDGGDTYIFGTTASNSQHLIYICKKL